MVGFDLGQIWAGNPKCWIFLPYHSFQVVANEDCSTPLLRHEDLWTASSKSADFWLCFSNDSGTSRFRLELNFPSFSTYEIAIQSSGIVGCFLNSNMCFISGVYRPQLVGAALSYNIVRGRGGQPCAELLWMRCDSGVLPEQLPVSSTVEWPGWNYKFMTEKNAAATAPILSNFKRSEDPLNL